MRSGLGLGLTRLLVFDHDGWVVVRCLSDVTGGGRALGDGFFYAHCDSSKALGWDGLCTHCDSFQMSLVVEEP